MSHSPLCSNAAFRGFWEFNRAVSLVQFIDDPFLRSEQKSCPVQLPLAVSGWGFREEFSTSAAVKSEKVEDDDEPMETAVEGKRKSLLWLDFIFTAFVALTLHSPQLYDNKHMRKDSVYIIILYFLNTTVISVFFYFLLAVLLN